MVQGAEITELLEPAVRHDYRIKTSCAFFLGGGGERTELLLEALGESTWTCMGRYEWRDESTNMMGYEYSYPTFSLVAERCYCGSHQVCHDGGNG